MDTSYKIVDELPGGALMLQPSTGPRYQKPERLYDDAAAIYVHERRCKAVDKLNEWDELCNGAQLRAIVSKPSDAAVRLKGVIAYVLSTARYARIVANGTKVAV